MGVVTLRDRVTVADTDRYLAFPAAGRVDDTLLATWGDSADHHDWASRRTMISMSTNQGRTWSAPQQLSAARGPVAVATNANARQPWAVLEMTNGPYRGWVRTSSDARSWSADRPVSWAGSSWKFPCGLTWIDDGTSWGLLLAVAYGGDGVLVSSSADGGSTWTHRGSPTDVTPFGDGTGESESTITVLRDGRLLMLTRQDRADGAVVWQRFSDDLGVSWTSKVQAFKSKGMPTCTLMPDGTLLVTVRDDTPDSTPESWAVAVSVDDAQTWQVEQLTDGWMMYGQIVPLTTGRAVLVGSDHVRGTATNADIFAQFLDVAVIGGSSIRARRNGQRWVVGDFRTGEVMAELSPLDGSTWSQGLDGSTISLKLAWDTAQTRTLISHIIPWRNYLAVLHGDEILAAGPFLADTWDADAGTWTLTAKGAEEWLSRREVIPRQAVEKWWNLYDRSKKAVTDWSVTTLSGTWPEIGAKIVSSALTWTGIDPYAMQTPAITVPTPAPYGARASYTCDAIDHVRLSEVLEDASRNADGVEYELRPVWRDNNPDAGVIEWQLRFGAPLITTGRMAAWAADSVHELRTSRDGSKLTTVLHLLGGRADDSPVSVTRRGAGSTIMLELLDSSHSGVSDSDELTKIGDELLHYVGRPRVSYEFSVPMDTVGLWRPGDFALLSGDPDAALSWQARIPHIDAEVRLRIVGRSGSAGSGLVSVQSQRLAPEDSDAWIQAS